ncbi:AEC family transporter [Xylophilus rhododendri]|uniref:AEC family transporter n=1 Tax=Xylophilus rhododendri TaxID=2697032 RepID=A0A857J154_9BURK|nr:AEC family transporter [Xylophilus rhododendri]QHI97317.1 AEC family transporter [Xylophilus rhododendri]
MNYAQLLFPDFSLILCGYLLCRFTALDRPVWQQAETLVYYFLFPVLLFQSIAKAPLELRAASSMVAAGVLTGLVGIGLAYAVPHLPWLRNRVDRRDAAASAQVAFRFNSYIALALAERLAGPAGGQAIAVLIGVGVPIYNVAAVWPMARHGGHKVLGSLLRNPLIVGTCAALAFNLAGLTIPDLLAPAVSRIGAAALALGLLCAGAGMQFSAMSGGLTLGACMLLIRHLVSPIAALGFSKLFHLGHTQATVLLMFAALPTASSCYVLAARMGYNGPYVAGLVTLSTVAGVVSLPFALSLLRWL